MKKVISLTLVSLSLLILCCEMEDVSMLFWLKLSAMGMIALVAAWNHAFDERNNY